MTNDRAVEILKAIIFMLKNDDYSDEVEEAINKAIEALKGEAWKEEHPVSPLLQKLATDLQPSKQDTDDTISRAAAIKAIDVKNVNKGIISALQSIIEELPSAQPELPIKEKCAFCPHCNNCDVNDDLSIQPCADTISRQAACDAVCKAGCDSGFCGVECPEVMALRNLQPVQPEVLACGEGELIAQPELLKDGTLMIDVPDLDTIHRVIVSSGKMCKIFYMDDDSERRSSG